MSNSFAARNVHHDQATINRRLVLLTWYLGKLIFHPREFVNLLNEVGGRYQ